MATLDDLRRNFIKYSPYCGAVGYSVLALSSMGVEPPAVSDLSRVLTFHSSLCISHIGIAVYIYNRQVFEVLQPTRTKRILWSAFGTIMMNLGSLLFWAMAKELGPANKLVRAVVALGTAGGMLYVATDYLTAIDELRKGVLAERVEDGEKE